MWFGESQVAATLDITCHFPPVQACLFRAWSVAGGGLEWLLGSGVEATDPRSKRAP